MKKKNRKSAIILQVFSSVFPQGSLTQLQYSKPNFHAEHLLEAPIKQGALYYINIIVAVFQVRRSDPISKIRPLQHSSAPHRLSIMTFFHNYFLKKGQFCKSKSKKKV